MERRARLQRIGAAGLIVLGIGIAHGGPMSTTGQFDVSPMGAATYTIPIQVPPGTAGIEPKLSLTYNSQAGNGLLGVGWSLSGLSAITRCPRTVAQDGVRGGINYDLNDRYCLDGQRLMAINGAYGADGTEYRTERESFSKMVSYGSAGNGPAWFKVWTKAGQTLEYGNTEDSRIEAQGKSSVRVWAMNKLSDTSGNYLTVSYTEDDANGDYYPDRILYTGNDRTGVIPNNSVIFSYETQPAPFDQYVGGSVIRGLERLSKITTSIGMIDVDRIVLTYRSGSASGRSQLSSIVCCDVTASCQSPLSLTWSDSSNPMFAAALRAGSGGGEGYWPYYAMTTSQSFQFAADFNGDGMTDIAYWDGGWHVLLSTGSGFAPVQNWGMGGGKGYWPQYYTSSSQPFQFAADFNGDGMTDIAYWDDGWNLLLSTGSGFLPVQNWGAGGGTGYWPYHTMTTSQPFQFAADFNGDGMTDIAYWDGGWHVLLSTGSGFAPVQNWGTGGEKGYWPQYYTSSSQSFQFAADFNGDGMTDIAYWDDGWKLLLSTGSGFLPVQNWGAGGGTGYWPYYTMTTSQPFQFAADFNGDGMTDIAYWDGGWHVLLSTGSGFAPVQNWGMGGGKGYWPQYYVVPAQRFQFLGDFNRDGRTDIIYWDDGWNVLLSTGRGFSQIQNWGAGGGTGYWPWYTTSTSQSFQFAADFNGDGATDIIYWDGVAGGGAWQVLLSNSGPADLVTALIGDASTTVSYRPLTNSLVYEKEVGSQYPVREVAAPLYVVDAVNSSNMVGGSITTTYAYGGAKADAGTGRGFLGMRWTQATNPASGITIRTEYRQDWPYVGLPSVVKKTTSSGGNAGVLSQTTYSYGCLNPQLGSNCTIAAGNRYFPYVSQSVESGWDLNGTALPSVTTTNAFDAWGNATQVSVTSSDGYNKSTTNTYSNDTTNWILGRLLRAQVQSVTP